MAKGNMLLGYSQGSVGDVTFYRSGGSQRARARNRNPSNPRSGMQQTQRALFTNCVKFHKLAVAKFFKFAFENKKPNESDYNAFMRENLKRGVMMSKTAYNVESYIALGNWLLTRGSLPTIYNANNVSTFAPVFDLGVPYSTSVTEDTTIAEISTAMIASGRYQVGDIITIVNYRGEGLLIPNATPNAVADQLALEFNYWQFLVDPNNTNTFMSIFGDNPIFHLARTSTENLAIMYGVDSGSANSQWVQDYETATVIHSRNTANGLVVSTQELTCNPRYTSALSTALTDATYRSAVLADWSASGKAVLQGEGLEVVNPSDVGDYVIGNQKGADNEISIANVSGCAVGDGWSIYIQSTKQLSDEQVRLILRQAIVTTEGLTVNFGVGVQTETAPGSLYGYSCELLTITSLPATITLRLQSGATRSAAYTA